MNLKVSLLPIIMIMLIGAAEEPFLPACLECLHGNIDRAVINDNSGKASHPNLSYIKKSKLYAEGRVDIINSSFLGFGACRNLCLDFIRKFAEPDTWIFIDDADEVHPADSLKTITRDILPSLPDEIGIVDGYFYDFFQSPQYYQAFNHRHNLFFRLNSEIMWTRGVHEQLQGLQGKRLVLPYRFFHYGYLKPSSVVREKWHLYGTLGDTVSGNQALNVDEVIERMSQQVWRFDGSHPAATTGCISDYYCHNASAIEQFQTKAKLQRYAKLRSAIKKNLISLKMLYLRIRVHCLLGNSIRKNLHRGFSPL